ncbi:hypothetical protein ACFGVR_15540 [Mucilaginibacter sp. AW1-3]
MTTNVPLSFPHLPFYCPRIDIDGMSLCEIRDYLTKLEPDPAVEETILSSLEGWQVNPEAGEPLFVIHSMLDSFRLLPRNNERVRRMNTFVRTLGRPDIFAEFLDMIRAASLRTDTREQALTKASRLSSKHAVYGWSGQTRLALSGTKATVNTVIPEPGVQNFLGKTPTSAWSLSMHIWQPNVRAEGFLCGHREDENIIAEPPHSHPFDFASMLVTGKLHQSIYLQKDANTSLSQTENRQLKGRYDGIALEHVHGVWPPHDGREECAVMTLNERVELRAGDSYYMSAETIHDVQIDANIAQDTPAITLFLRSESFVKPHVYMAPQMADFHETHPDLKNQGSPLTEKAWNAKLTLVADYVRGKTTILNLSEIVNYDNEYAFFHR